MATAIQQPGDPRRVVVVGTGRPPCTPRRTPARRTPCRIAPCHQRDSASRCVHGQFTFAVRRPRPSLPGLRMPVRVERALHRLQHRQPVAERFGHEAAAVEPDPVMVRQVAAVRQHCPLTGVPQRHVGRLDLLGRRGGGEREVQAGAVEVAVRQVAGGGAGVRHGHHGRADLVEDGGQCSPRCRDLERVDHEALAGQGLQGARVVAVLPASGPPAVVVSACRRSDERSATIAITASTIAGSPSSSTSRAQFVPSPSWPRWLSTASYSRSTAGVAPRRRMRRQASSPAANDGERVRRAALGWPGTGWAQPDRGDHAERALAADEHLGEVGSDRRPGRSTGADHRAVGQHDLETDDHVLDLAVAGAVLAGAAAGHPAPDGGDVEALREVADGEAVLRWQLAFEIGPERAGQHLDDAAHVASTDTMPCSREVEHHPTEQRARSAAHAAAATGRRDRHACAWHRPQHGRHLGGRRGAAHRGPDGAPRRRATSAAPAATSHGWPRR